MQKPIFIPFILFTLIIYTQAQNLNDTDIQQILKNQQFMEDAWNNGDLDGYMSFQWKSDSTIFMSKNSVNYGYDKVYEIYKRGYPTKATMGKLKITVLELEKLCDDSAYMIGKYEVFAERGDQSGHFTLIWKKIEGEWLIVLDHS